MAKGSPILAAWSASDSTVRTFELVGDAFVQTGSLGGLNHNETLSSKPMLYWHHSGSMLVMRRGISNAGGYHTVMHPDARKISEMGGLAVANGYGNYGAAFEQSSNSEYYVEPSPGNDRTIFRFQLLATGELVFRPIQQSGETISLYPGTLSVSPDGKNLIRAGIFPTNNINLLSKLDVSGGDTTTGYLVPASMTWASMVWSPDSTYLLTSDLIRAVQLHKLVGNSLVKTYELNSEYGAPVALAFSPDAQHCAIGYLNGGRYFTAIYRRKGGYLQQLQLIHDFGALLGFTADGNILVDAASRKAYRLSANNFTEVVGALTNVPAGVTLQAMSPNAHQPTGIGKLYDGVLLGLLSGQVSLEGLKVTLLTADAAFRSTDGTVDQVVAGCEVTSGMWPAGGIAINNGRIVAPDQGTVKLVGDDAERIIVREPLVARYALVYNGTRPISFLDFGDEVVISNERKLTIDFDSVGIVTFEK